MNKPIPQLNYRSVTSELKTHTYKHKTTIKKVKVHMTELLLMTLKTLRHTCLEISYMEKKLSLDMSWLIP